MRTRTVAAVPDAIISRASLSQNGHRCTEGVYVCVYIFVRMSSAGGESDRTTESRHRCRLWLGASSFGILAAHYDNGLFVCIQSQSLAIALAPARATHQPAEPVTVLATGVAGFKFLWRTVFSSQSLDSRHK